MLQRFQHDGHAASAAPEDGTAGNRDIPAMPGADFPKLGLDPGGGGRGMRQRRTRQVVSKKSREETP
jgi:hypothetical protein